MQTIVVHKYQHKEMKYRNIRGQNYIEIYCIVWVSNNVIFLRNTIEHNLCIKYLFKEEQKTKHTSKDS